MLKYLTKSKSNTFKPKLLKAVKKKRRQKQRQLWRSILFEQASELNAQWQ